MKTSQARINQIIKYHKKDWSQRRIADKLDMGRETVRKYIEEYELNQSVDDIFEMIADEGVRLQKRNKNIRMGTLLIALGLACLFAYLVIR